MPNENCLDGFACPSCGSEEPFKIECKTTVLMWDEGSDHHEDLEWEEDSRCSCTQCDFGGTVKDFRNNTSSDEDEEGENA